MREKMVNWFTITLENDWFAFIFYFYKILFDLKKNYLNFKNHMGITFFHWNDEWFALCFLVCLEHNTEEVMWRSFGIMS